MRALEVLVAAVTGYHTYIHTITVNAKKGSRNACMSEHGNDDDGGGTRLDDGSDVYDDR